MCSIRPRNGDPVVDAVARTWSETVVDVAVDVGPGGEESARMDLDAEILTVTRSCAGGPTS